MEQERFHVGREFADQTERRIWCFGRWVTAATFVMDMMREYADEDDDRAYDSATPDLTGYSSFEDWMNSDDAPSMRATVDSILRDDSPAAGEDFGAIIQDNDGRHVSFWLQRVLCADPEHLSTGGDEE